MLFLIGIVSFETVVLTEFGCGLYISGLSFIIVVDFNVRKLYFMYNQTANVRRTRIANSMLLLFWIIIMIYLLSTIYPLFYITDYAVFKDRLLLDRSLYMVYDILVLFIAY